MVVQRRHLQPVVQCRTHDWIDLIFEQDDIAHDHGVVPGAGEGCPSGQTLIGISRLPPTIAWKSLRGEADLEHALPADQRALKPVSSSIRSVSSAALAAVRLAQSRRL